MRRPLPVLLLVLLVLLAACDAAPPPPPGPAVRVRALFPVGGIENVIVVDAVERLALREAALVAPDGALTPASYINAAATPRFATGQWTAANPWHDSVAPPNEIPALAVANGQASAALRSTEQVLAIVSTADIPLPDPVAYRRDWAHYHIRLSFGTPPGEVETRDIAAPAPPPETPAPPRS